MSASSFLGLTSSNVGSPAAACLLVEVVAAMWLVAGCPIAVHGDDLRSQAEPAHQHLPRHLHLAKPQNRRPTLSTVHQPARRHSLLHLRHLLSRLHHLNSRRLHLPRLAHLPLSARLRHRPAPTNSALGQRRVIPTRRLIGCPRSLLASTNRRVPRRPKRDRERPRTDEAHRQQKEAHRQ